MCDVFVLRSGDATFFAKNSDREAAEPHVVVRVGSVRGDRTTQLRATHVNIPQASSRFEILLAKPAWTWGGEMGANEKGVVVGNTALFTRARSMEPGLIGMDLVRLGLERGDTAASALAVIADLIERFGQGGPCGYRLRGFQYDNAFVIADHREAWVLEAAGRDWVAKKVERSWALSNCMTIGDDYDRCSEGLGETAARLGLWRRGEPLHFKRTFEGPVFPILSGAPARRAKCLAGLEDLRSPSCSDLAARLRMHTLAPASGSVESAQSLCMHPGVSFPFQTTGSMLSELRPDRAVHFFTGTPATCLSIFKAADFDRKKRFVVAEPQGGAAAPLWTAHEAIRQLVAAGKLDGGALQLDLAKTEEEIWRAAANDDLGHADAVARSWESRWQERARLTDPFSTEPVPPRG